VADAGVELPQPRSLALVPGAGAGGSGVRHLQTLQGGSVNNLWCVDTDAGRFLLREDGAAWRRPGVDRDREGIAHALAAEAGIAPRILARTDNGDVQVTEFIDGRVWTAPDYELPVQRERLCALLGRVHRLLLPEDARWPFQPLQLAIDYVQRAGNSARALALLAQAQQAGLRLATAAARRVLVHGDALAGNVIEADGRLWLIDWEFTQCADPLWDLAAFAVWHPAAVADLPHCARLAGIDPEGLAARLDAALALHRALGGLWYLARGEEPPAALESGAGSGHTSAPCGLARNE
jgi:aminoglycoside phosphotransferase (APT) family kinase protein